MAVKRIKVTDPHTGVTLSVREGSAQARAWGVAGAVDAVADDPVSAADADATDDPDAGSEKRKPGRPKKS